MVQNMKSYGLALTPLFAASLLVRFCRPPVNPAPPPRPAPTPTEAAVKMPPCVTRRRFRTTVVPPTPRATAKAAAARAPSQARERTTQAMPAAEEASPPFDFFAMDTMHVPPMIIAT